MTSTQQAEAQAQPISSEKQSASVRGGAEIDSQAAVKPKLDACLYVLAGFFLCQYIVSEYSFLSW